MKLSPDNTLALMAEIGSIIDAHLLGRMRERKPVHEFGRRWKVVKHRERDGFRLYELQADADDLFDQHGDPRPIMCSDCRSFHVGKLQLGDPWRCDDCNSTRLLP